MTGINWDFASRIIAAQGSFCYDLLKPSTLQVVIVVIVKVAEFEGTVACRSYFGDRVLLPDRKRR